jgi:Cys-tRNA(Pro) deacylase
MTMRQQTIAGSTPALRFLLDNKVDFSCHAYSYEEHGGTATPARELNVDEHAVIKTLLFEDQDGLPLVVLMHGDRKVSAKELARQLPCKKVQPCKPDIANRHSGYLVGGTSPCHPHAHAGVYGSQHPEFAQGVHQRRPPRPASGHVPAGHRPPAASALCGSGAGEITSADNRQTGTLAFMPSLAHHPPRMRSTSEGKPLHPQC